MQDDPLPPVRKAADPKGGGLAIMLDPGICLPAT
jgi:hypothetical protein